MKYTPDPPHVGSSTPRTQPLPITPQNRVPLEMIISPCKQKVITKEKQVEIRLLRFAVSLFRPVDGDAKAVFQIFLTFTNYNEYDHSIHTIRIF